METKTTTKEGAALQVDPATGARAIESMVLRGDLSGLGPTERARYYEQVCKSLGLNPHAQPFAFLRLNGKEVLYATRSATDQLAAIHGLNREIIDGPKVIDLAGTKLVFAVCRATHPNGRVETSVATVPLVDPVNVLMKAETKAKRRATLSILGLGVLDETEGDAATQGEGVDLTLAEPPPAAAPEEPAPPRGEVAVDAPAPEVPAALEAFYSRLLELEQAPAAVTLWLKHRPALAEVPKGEREKAFEATTNRLAELGQENPKRWLKAAIAEEDARRVAASGKSGAASAAGVA